MYSCFGSSIHQMTVVFCCRGGLTCACMDTSVFKRRNKSRRQELLIDFNCLETITFHIWVSGLTVNITQLLSELILEQKKNFDFIVCIYFFYPNACLFSLDSDFIAFKIKN
jgi:hypothetical protein